MSETGKVTVRQQAPVTTNSMEMLYSAPVRVGPEDPHATAEDLQKAQRDRAEQNILLFSPDNSKSGTDPIYFAKQYIQTYREAGGNLVDLRKKAQENPSVDAKVRIEIDRQLFVEDFSALPGLESGADAQVYHDLLTSRVAEYSKVYGGSSEDLLQSLPDDQRKKVEQVLGIPPLPETLRDPLSPDMYQRLGVSKTASKEEIKRAWRKAAQAYHPDTHPNDPDAQRNFQNIQEAYDTIGGIKKNGKAEKLPEEGLSSDQIQEKTRELFSNLGVDGSNFPQLPAEVASQLEGMNLDDTAPEIDDELTPLDEEIGRKEVTIRELAGWMFLLSLDLAFNHGYGTQHMLDQVMRKNGLAPLMRWMGMDESLISNLIDNGHGMANTLANLDTPMLKQQLDRMSGHQVYEFLAGMSPRERSLFTTEGIIESTYHPHTFDQTERQKIFDKLSPAQKARLKIEEKE